MAETATRIPSLDDDYPLTQAQIDFFRENGFVYLPRLCSPEEVAYFRPAIVRATYANNAEKRPLAERDEPLVLALRALPEEEARRAELETSERAELHLQRALHSGDLLGLPLPLNERHALEYRL